MTCYQTRRLLSVRREWMAQERSGVEAHLAACPACRVVAREYELMDRRLDRLPSPAALGTMPAGAQARSMARVRTIGTSAAGWPRQVLRVAALAVLALLVLTASLVWWGRSGPPIDVGSLAALVPAGRPEPSVAPAGPRDRPEFSWPATGELSQPFSEQHPGLDIKNLSGTPVYAIADGHVTGAGWGERDGNYVLLDHGEGLASFYSHLTRVYVDEGQSAGRGQLIGKMGSTGYSTGPHLHFEIRREGIAVDPLQVVPVEEWLDKLTVDRQVLQAMSFVWPVRGLLTQTYSAEHLALDIATFSGSAVRAAAGGEVAALGQNERDGNYVWLDHGDGLTSFYSHLRAIHVQEGEPVDAGQQVGEVGSTGWSTGPHLHFALHEDGVPVNPMDVLP